MVLLVLFASCHERNRQQGQGREAGAAAARTAVSCRRVRGDRRRPSNSKHQYLGGAACGICRLNGEGAGVGRSRCAADDVRGTECQSIGQGTAASVQVISESPVAASIAE